MYLRFTLVKYQKYINSFWTKKSPPEAGFRSLAKSRLEGGTRPLGINHAPHQAPFAVHLDCWERGI